MRLAERLLLLLSRRPGNKDYDTTESWNIDNALSILCRDFPDFMSSIVDREVIDFGCGMGYQVVAMALYGAKYVVGIDINEDALKKGQKMAHSFGITEKVEFIDKLTDRWKGTFDIVISQNSMEHFGDPIRILNEMKSMLKAGGRLFITFGPPWYAPWGSHMHFFTESTLGEYSIL